MERQAAAALLLGGCVAWGCGVTNSFTCAQNSQCGVDGVCQPTGGCSFPDDDCPSGQRYGDYAPSGLGGLCVDPTSDTDPGGTTLGSGDATGTSGPSSLDDTGSPPGTTTSGLESTGPTSSTDATTTDSLTTGPVGTDSSGVGSSTGEAVDSSLLLWFRYDDGLAGPITNSGSLAVDGECLGESACPEVVAGVEGDAALLDGNVGIVVPHVAALSLPGEFTVAAWVQSGVLDSSPHSIVGKAFGAGNFNSFNFVFTTGADADAEWEVALFLNTTSTNDYVYADFDYPENAWVHVAAVWDGDQASVYVDGDVVTTEPLPEPGFDDNPLTIGFDFNAGNAAQFYNGSIDDLRLYGRALDADELAALASP